MLNEPDIALITPEVINNRYEELKQILSQFNIQSLLHPPQRDYNKMVSRLNEDAVREAHANYLAKLKKKAEQERRILKREVKRRARLEQ